MSEDAKTWRLVAYILAAVFVLCVTRTLIVEVEYREVRAEYLAGVKDAQKTLGEAVALSRDYGQAIESCINQRVEREEDHDAPKGEK